MTPDRKRIVAKVDQLLSQCDDLSARLKDRQTITYGLLVATIYQLLSCAELKRSTTCL